MELAPRQLDLFPRYPGAKPPAVALVERVAPEPAPPPRPSLRPQPATPVAPAPSSERRDRPALVAPTSSKEQRLARARDLAHRIAGLVGNGTSVLVTVHDNRSTMMSYRRQAGVLRVRLHHMFLEAPDDIVTAIADYAGRGVKSAGRRLDAFIASKQERIRHVPSRGAALESRGQCFDLGAIFDRMNTEYFQGGIRARIGWGRQTGRRRRKSIRLGVYDHAAREIRLHPALDRPDVPLFFVEFIVFHEMLHQLFPSDRAASRHVHHPRAFRDRERAFPRYAAAIAWERDHLKDLLRR